MKKNLPFLLVTALLLNSCGGDEETVPDCSVSDLAIVIQSTTNDACGQSVGSISAIASNGAGDYQYSIDGQTFQTVGTFDGLAADSYTVTVKDANECMKTATANLTDEGGLTITASSTSTACGTSSGSITAEASGEGGSFEYQLDDGTFAASGAFASVSGGLHTVTVKDENGCLETKEVLVETGISYLNEIAPIISANCAVAGCHVGTAGIPDFRSFASIKENAATIKLKTGDKSMPKTGSLTDPQIQAIACWVDDGAKDN